MKTLRWTAGVAAGLLAVVVLAGFFHADGRQHTKLKMEGPGIVSAPLEEDCEREKQEQFLAMDGSVQGTGMTMRGMIQTPLGSYRRKGDASLEVEDTIETYETLSKKVAALHGELVEVVIEGGEIGRSGRILMEIPSDVFDSFLGECRKLGKILHEQITVQRMPKGGAVSHGSDEPDPREIALVSLTLRDQKVSPLVEQSQNVLAVSFSKSWAHVLRGLAVLVEGVGYVLPFAIAFLVLAVPAVVAVRLARRSRKPEMTNVQAVA